MIKKILPAIFLTLLALFVGPKVAHASVLFLQPSSGSVASGSTLVVTVRLDTQGESTNAVSAYLAYPQDKFDVSYINSAGSAFSFTAEESGGGGSIKITRGSTGAVSGSNVLVARVGLRAKTTGDATVYFVGGSHVPKFSDNTESLNLNASRGGTYKIGAAGTGQAAKTKDVAPPLISDINVTDISTNSATINWKTNEKADSFVEFGLEKGTYLGSVSDSALVDNHSLKLTGEQLQAGLKLFYRVQSKDEAGNIGKAEEAELQLKGYDATLKIVDNSNNPLSGAEVLLYPGPVKGTTNESGEVSFQNPTLGKHQIAVTYKEQETQSEIEVIDSLDVQIFTVKVDLKPSYTLSGFKFNPLTVVAVLIILVTVAFLIYLLMKNRKNLKEAGIYFNPMSQQAGEKQPQQQASPVQPETPANDDTPVVVYKEK